MHVPHLYCRASCTCTVDVGTEFVHMADRNGWHSGTVGMHERRENLASVILYTALVYVMYCRRNLY
jgi:hypothetical protein